MLRNYIVIALRLLRKNKIFSLINILGLSTGIACCILIALYIQDEFNYEKGFPEGHKVFRINSAFGQGGVTENSPYTAPAIAFGLQQALPGIEQATRVVQFLGVEQHIVRYNDKTFFEKRACLVDSTFLQVFPYKLNEGNAATALDAPASALISESLSERIFGDQSPLEELLIVSSGQSVDTFQITGVVATPKYPSHIDSDLYLSMSSNGLGSWILSQTTWSNNNLVGSYLKLQDPRSYKDVEAKFAEQVEIYAGEELKASGRQKELSLQPLGDIRLYSNFSGNNSTIGITYVYIIGTIGIFILLLACINFMNLTTARSAQRASEVGIRKSMGAFRANLVRQFLGESLIIVCFALMVSFLMVLLGLPLFNTVMQKDLSLNENNFPFIAISAILISLFTGLIAGSYPAFFLSSFRPTQVLKGLTHARDRFQWLRKGFVVFQFVITITLLSSIVIMRQQLEYIQSKSLGFNTEHVIMIPLRTPTAVNEYYTLKKEFSRIPGVKVVSGTSSLPSTPLFSDWGIYKQGSSNEQSVQHEMVWVDVDYFATMDIHLMVGRDFIPEQDNVAGDTINPWNVIVNETSLKRLDINLDNAVGTTLYFSPEQGTRYEYRIIGVVKDFHQFSLHREVSPMTLILSPNRSNFSYMAVSVNISGYQSIQAQMKKVWDERVNDIPFESVFLNENVKKLYKAEARTSTMLTISTTIAMIISCLGLYGLSIFVAERKTREIGIRKVVGASVESIVGMLSKEFIVLIAISFAIAIPLGYYMMDRWLEDFAYKISPGVNVFLIAGALAVCIAWLTISFESFRAARRNPVDTLRNQ